MQAHGIISQLRRQVRFRIIPPLYGTRVTSSSRKTVVKPYLIDRAAYYTCDFLYREGGRIVIEDVKSKATARLADYGLRRKLVLRLVAGHNVRRGREAFVFREHV